MQLPRVIAVACSCGMLLLACSSDDSGGDATTTIAAAATAAPTTAATAADGGSANEASVDIADFAFDPDEIHIATGGTVTFNNTDDQQHTATGSGVFDTGAIAAGSSASFTFDTAGEVSFICSFHPFMKGTVVVG